jgi:hypothetical protein
MVSLQQNQRTRGQNRFFAERGKEVTQIIMYLHVSKCKNDKIKGEKNNNIKNSHYKIPIFIKFPSISTQVSFLKMKLN